MKIQPRPQPVLSPTTKAAPVVVPPLQPQQQLEAPEPKPAVQLAPSEGKPVQGAGALGWQTRGTWYDETMLKPPFQTNLPLDDTFDGPPSLADVALPQLSETDNRQQVYEKLRDVPLSRLLVAPGYRYYRHPEQFPEVLAQVKANQRVDTRPSILDVHTDGHGKVLNVDLRSHHLRMAAFIENGALKLGDLPFDQVLIKTDGVQREDTLWKQKVHGYALPADVLAKQGVHVVDDQQDPATIEIDNLQNWELGSRTSMKQFHQTLLHRTQPKVGVVFGSVEGLLERAVKLREEKGLDEVVLAPSGRVDSATLAAIRSTRGVNLYLDQPVPLRETFPDFDYARLVRYRLNLIYGVDMHGIVEEAAAAAP